MGFLSHYAGGARLKPPQSTSMPLADMFKAAQRNSSSWRNTWAMYCAQCAGGKNDPGKHDEAFLVGFLDFVAESTMPLPMMGAKGMGKGMGKTMAKGMMMKGKGMGKGV